MRLLFLVAVSMIVFWTVPVLADGVLIGKVPSGENIDPNSYPKDISEPEQKAVIIHYAPNKERLILQITYKGKASEFAWLVPTPSRPKVTRYDQPVFHQLHQMTAPRIKYWFDADNKLKSGASYRYSKSPAAPAGALSVEVLEQKQVGIYDAAVLRAGNENDLIAWLRKNGYLVTPGIAPALRDYINRKWVFTAMKINSNSPRVEKKLNEGTLQSVQFDFTTSEPVYPLKISSLNPGVTKVLLYVISQHRMEANKLKTECVVPSDQFLYMGINDDEWPLPYLTRLSASLKAADMDQDLVLRRASSDRFMDPPHIRPPFLLNLGALTLLIVSLGLDPTVAICLFVLFCIGAVMHGGRKRWWLWAGIGLVIVIISRSDWQNVISDIALSEDSKQIFRNTGAIALILCTAALVLAAKRFLLPGKYKLPVK